MMKKLFNLSLSITLIFLLLHSRVNLGYVEYINTHPLILTPTYSGDLQLFTDGTELFDQLLKDIRSAKESIYIHFFIFRSDDIGNDLLDLLSEKSELGVNVILSVDYIGGRKIPNRVIQKLKAKNILFIESRKPSLPYFFYSIQHRNHRKLISIDNHVSYIGGFNVGDEYISKSKRFGYWRDYHVRISGKGTSEVENQLMRDFKEDAPYYTSNLKEKDPFYEFGRDFAFMFSTGETYEEKLVEIIQTAKKRIIIATPYFIPSDHMINTLKNKISNGVDVILLVPDNTDAWFTKPPSYPITEELMSLGATIYLYEKGFFHGKVMLIDQDVAVVGTANWDSRSFHLNDEASVIIYKSALLHDIEKELTIDFQNSRILTPALFEELPQWELFLKQTPKWITYYF
ncbi:phospholipase D-like domain-containing protein [Bacillus coahuilensis]|uniref:phospholipase D-like domain-containing protein n=1 Tax=Bacillus coahuilensis TaxID=408580 RepID=UPI0007504AA1|nr:phospholipase D-like domain-containing protein [Bacillus coahuilensis]